MPEHPVVTRRLQFGLKDNIADTKHDKKRKRKQKARRDAKKRSKKARGTKKTNKKTKAATQKDSSSSAATPNVPEEDAQAHQKHSNRRSNKRLNRLRSYSLKCGRTSKRKGSTTSTVTEDAAQSASAAALNIPPAREKASSSQGPIKHEKVKAKKHKPENKQPSSQQAANNLQPEQKRKAKKEKTPKTQTVRSSAQKSKDMAREGKTCKKTTNNTKTHDACSEDYAGCIEQVVQECMSSDCNHPSFNDIESLSSNASFQISAYWTRGAVGVKVSRDLLPAELGNKGQKSKSKAKDAKKRAYKSKNFSQVAYFSKGGCVFVNYGMAQAFAI